MDREPMPAPVGDFLTLDDAMARHIESALAQTHGRIEGRFGTAYANQPAYPAGPNA